MNSWAPMILRWQIMAFPNEWKPVTLRNFSSAPALLIVFLKTFYCKQNSVQLQATLFVTLFVCVYGMLPLVLFRGLQIWGSTSSYFGFSHRHPVSFNTATSSLPRMSLRVRTPYIKRWSLRSLKNACVNQTPGSVFDPTLSRRYLLTFTINC